MRRLSSVLAAGLFAALLAFQPAVAQVFLTPAQIAALGHKATSGGGSSYIPPTLTGLAAQVGDSFVAQGGGDTWASSNFTTAVGGSNSFTGQIASRCGGCLYFNQNFQYAVTGITSYSTAGILNTQRNDDGQAASTGSTLSGTTLTIGTATNASFALNEDLTGTSITGQGIHITGFGTAVNGTGSPGVRGGAGTYTVTNPNSVSVAVGQAIGASINPGYTYTGFTSSGEKNFASNNTNNYSPLSDPANLVILSDGGNDALWAGSSGSGPCKTSKCSMQEIGLILDALGPNGATFTQPTAFTVAGANKRVILLTSKAQGVAWFGSETHTMGSTVTATNHTGLVAGDDTCTDAGGTSWNDAPVVAPGVSGGAGQNVVMSRVASGPAAGQYSFNSATGVYTFSAADATTYSGKTISLSYCQHGSNQITGTNLNWFIDLIGWMKSNAADYVSAFDGSTDFAIPGALYNRPWVSVADTFSVLADPATAKSNVVTGGTCVSPCTYLPIPGTQDTSGHMAPLGSSRVSQVVAAAIAALLPTQHADFTWPTANNFWIGTSSGSSFKEYFGALPGVMASQIASKTAAGQFEVCYGIACAVADGTGAMLSNGAVQGTATFGTAGTNVGCVNYTSAQTCKSVNTVGEYDVTFSVAPPSNGRVTAFLDPVVNASGVLIGGNVLQNGQLDWAIPTCNTTCAAAGSSTNVSTCNTTGSGTSGSNFVPANWALSADANTQTALTNATLVVTCGYGTAPDGNPGFFVQYYGQMSTAPTFSLKQNLNAAGYPASAYITANVAQTRGAMRITVTKGPADADSVQRYYGWSTPKLAQSNTLGTSGNVYGVNCPTTNCTTLTGQISDAAGNWSDAPLVDGSGAYLKYDWVTPLANAYNDAGSNTLTSSALTATLTPVASAPISGKVWFQNAALRVVAH